MHVEIETEIRNGLAVTATGDYDPGAEPLPVRGEHMAVHCPGWPEGCDDIEVRTVAAPHFRQPMSRDDEERIAEALTIAGAEALRDEWERVGEARFEQMRDDLLIGDEDDCLKDWDW